MPRIQEYLPETEGSGPAGGVDPNLTVVGEAGRGIEKFGSDVTQAVDLVNRRQEQTETADAYSNVAQARSDFTQKLQQQTNDGTLNTGQFQQEYEDWVDDQSQNYNTPGGKDYFARQAARLHGSLTRSAANGQVQIAYANGKASYSEGINNDVATVTSDPTQHDDVLASNLANLDQMVKDGRIKESDVPALQQQTQQQLAIGAIRGAYRTDPDLAQKILDDGNLNSVLTPQQQKSMYGEVKSAQTAKATDIEQQIRLQKAIQQQKADQFLQQNFTKMASGNLSSQDIMKAVSSGTMSPQQGDLWLEKNRVLQGQVESNPITVNKLRDRIYLPDNNPNQIKDQYQLMAQIGKGVSAQDVHQMLPLLDKSPQGRNLIQQESQLMQAAKIKFGLSGGFGAILNSDGPAKLNRFTNDLEQAKSDMAAQGKPVSSLFDARSKDYFGNKLDQYNTTPSQDAAAKASLVTGQSQPPVNIYTPPGVTAQSPKTGPKRIPGESPADFLKRTKGGN